MGDILRGRVVATDWPLAYLTVTAVSIGVLVGVRHWFPKSMGRYELLPLGFVAGLYGITSTLHYYEVSRVKTTREVVSVDER